MVSRMETIEHFNGFEETIGNFQWFLRRPSPLNVFWQSDHCHQWFFNGFWYCYHRFQWFSMVLDHWSNDAMVSMDRYGLVSAVVSKGKLLAKIFVSILSNQNISKGGRGCLSVCPSVPHFWAKSIKACIYVGRRLRKTESKTNCQDICLNIIQLFPRESYFSRDVLNIICI